MSFRGEVLVQKVAPVRSHMIKTSPLWGRIWSKHRLAECVPCRISHSNRILYPANRRSHNQSSKISFIYSNHPGISEALPAAHQVAAHCGDLSMPCGAGAEGIPLWLEADTDIGTTSSTWTKEHPAKSFGLFSEGQSTHGWGLGAQLEEFQIRHRKHKFLYCASNPCISNRGFSTSVKFWAQPVA